MITSISPINRGFCFVACTLAAIWLACVTSGKSVAAQTSTVPKDGSAPAVSVKLSENGRALLPILISAQATQRERAAAVLLIGASELALEHAVWDLLYRLGHRQFFPGATW